MIGNSFKINPLDKRRTTCSTKKMKVRRKDSYNLISYITNTNFTAIEGCLHYIFLPYKEMIKIVMVPRQ